MLASLLSGLLGLLTGPAPAAEASDQWLVHPWQTDDGLPDNSVEGVAQTADGYLWIGTPTGLARFDGLRFEALSLTNIIAPPNRGVILMRRGAQGVLWLAMDRGGVVCLNGKASRAFTEPLPNLIPYDLAEDSEGAGWISYRNGAVYRIKDQQVTAFTAREGLPAGENFCGLTADHEGRVWFAKAGQVGVFRLGVFKTLCRLSEANIRLAPARSGGVWLSGGQQLFKCDEAGGLQDFGKFHTAGSGTTAAVVLEDHEGAVWIGTTYSGLFRHDAAGFESIPTSHQGILSLTEDNEGNIWAGTFGGGLDRIRRRAITLEGEGEGLPFSSVTSICEDAGGMIWAATQNGVLVQKTAGQWNPVPPSAQWTGDATCVAAGPNGDVWIGTRIHGLYCWRDGHFVAWGGQPELAGKTLHTLLVAKNGAVWMGQENPASILCWQAGKLETFPAPPDSRIVRAMVEDADGTLWAGTSKGLLLRIRHHRLEAVALRPGQEPASIRCLCATPDGALWIGYAGWGVGCLKEGQYSEIDAEQGLYDDYVSHIVPDDRGWLWFGSNRGIFKVRQRDLEEVAAGRDSLVRSVHYGRGDGLPSLQGTFGDSPYALRSRDGRIWLPMQTALVVADPGRLNERPQAPPTLLTKVLVDDQVVARYGGILPVGPDQGTVTDLGRGSVTLIVPPGHRHLEFEYAAFSFNNAENVQFRYRLQGLDDEWVEAGTRRSASYLPLPSGSYDFEMTACNSGGNWNTAGSRVGLVVTPFFWNTWWFRLAALAGFTLSLIAIVRYVSFRRLHHQLRRLEQQAALQKERTRIAKDIHDDLGADLAQIAFLGELARQDHAEPDKAAERIGTISATARQAIKSLDEIVWAVNPRNDTLAHLLDYAGQFAVDYLRVADIRCRLDFPETIPARELSADLRHNLFLVIKEILHNIIKHSAATEVRLRVAFTAAALDLLIEDNGRGFERGPDNALADGLRNMEQRMADIGGRCGIESRPGRGTQIRLHLPWPEKAGK